MYEFKEFPKRMFHRNGQARITVANRAEQEALGEDWAESMAAFQERVAPKPEEPPAPKPEPPESKPEPEPKKAPAKKATTKRTQK